MTITLTQFMAFAGRLVGTTVSTKTGQLFTVPVSEGSIYVTPLSTRQVQDPFTTNGVQKALSVYNQTASETPTDYSRHIRHSSYFVGLLKAFLAQARQQAVETAQQ